MKPKNPFMIERNDASGNDYYRVLMSDANNGPRGKWVDWDGTQFATFQEAQQIIIQHLLDALHGAKVIEIIDQTRRTIRH